MSHLGSIIIIIPVNISALLYIKVLFNAFPFIYQFYFLSTT